MQCTEQCLFPTEEVQHVRRPVKILMEKSKSQVVCKPNCVSLELTMDSQVLSMRITTHFDDQNGISDDVLHETNGSRHPCFHKQNEYDDTSSSYHIRKQQEVRA